MASSLHRPSAHIPKPLTTTSHDNAGGGKGIKPFKVVHLPKVERERGDENRSGGRREVGREEGGERREEGGRWEGW